jgi:hypothetical protein
MVEKLHCKKRLAVFLSPAGMSLTKLSVAGKYFNYSRPGRVWSVTSCLGTGKPLTFFYSVKWGVRPVFLPGHFSLHFYMIPKLSLYEKTRYNQWKSKDSYISIFLIWATKNVFEYSKCWSKYTILYLNVLSRQYVCTLYLILNLYRFSNGYTRNRVRIHYEVFAECV